MSNQLQPVAYLFTNTGVFDSNDGIHFITGIDGNNNVLTSFANAFGQVLVINTTAIMIGNSSVNTVVNSTFFTGQSNTVLIGGNGAAAGAAGANSQIQFNMNGVFGANANFTFNWNTGTLTVNGATINSSSFSGTSNNALFLGGIAANQYAFANATPNLTGYQTTVGLAANVAGLTSNNSLYLGGIAANQYAFANATGGGGNTSTANNSLFLGGIAANQYAFSNATNLISLGNTVSSFKVRPVANQALANTGFQKLVFANTLINVGNNWSNAAARWTPPAGPVYLMAKAWYYVGANSTAEVALLIEKNGQTISEQFNDLASATETDIQTSTIDIASGTDYYEAWIYNIATGALIPSTSNPYYTEFSGSSLVGPPGPAGATVNTCYIDVSCNLVFSVPSGTYTNVIFNVVTSDTTNAYSTSTGKFNPQVAGNYLVTSQVIFVPTVAAPFTSIYKNGVLFKIGNESSNGYATTVTSIVPMNGTTDYIQIEAFQQSGAAANCGQVGTAATNWLQAVLLPGSTAGPTGNSGVASTQSVYTPTVTCSSGSVTTGSASIRYTTVGKLCFYQGLITVSASSNTAGVLYVSVPVAPNITFAYGTGVGRENALTGKMFTCVLANSTVLELVNYDNAGGPSNTGCSMTFSGQYETP